MKVVIRTVRVQHYCYYRCTTTAVLLPLYYYRCTTTVVLLPLYYYSCTTISVLLQLYYYRCTTTVVPVWTKIGNNTRSKTSLKSAFSVHSTEPVYTKEMNIKRKRKKSTTLYQIEAVNTLKIKLHPHTWVCAQHIHKHLHTDMPLKQTLGS